MVKYLLDTQSFIWWVEGNKRLNRLARDTIENSYGNIYLSVASIWEMVIKISLRKLKLRNSLSAILTKGNFEILEIRLEHVLALQHLQNYHKDPFDRMLIAQAINEDLTIITADEKIKKYKVKAL